MLIELKTDMSFERKDGTLVKKPAGTRVNYSSMKVGESFQHLITTNDPKTGGRLTDVQLLPSNVRPVYL